MERFKIIEGFSGRYLATESGNIICSWNKKTMSPRKEKNGYLSIALRNGETRKQYSVHRLIAKAFIPNPKNKPDVNHKNGIKTDNRIENLEWMTRSENNKHSFDTGLKKGTNKGVYNIIYYNSKSKLYIKDCSIIEYLSIKDFARNHEVTHSAIQHAIKRGGKFKGGFII